MDDDNQTTAVWAAAILSGRSEAWRRFCQTLMGSRREAYAASRRRLGICREEGWLVTTTESDLVVVTAAATAADRLGPRMLHADRPFDHWYRQQLQQILGSAQVDAMAEKQSQLLYRWQAAP